MAAASVSLRAFLLSLPLVSASIGGPGEQSAGGGAFASKHIAGVPVYNYHLAQARPRSPDGSPAAWTRWLLFLRGPENATAVVRSVCDEGGPLRCHLHGHPEDGGVPFVEVEGTEGDLERLLQRGDIQADFIEPNADLYLPPELPAPPPSAEELHAQGTALPWGLERIALPRATTTGRGVHIYVLDTGVRTSHEDFGGRAVPTLDVSGGGRAVECHGDQRCAADHLGHGTHCASVAAGKQFGVAKGATIHAVKVLSDSGSGKFSWSVAALDWVTAKGLRPAVVSMSLGANSVIMSMRASITTATRMGVTVVVAAGNEADSTCLHSPGFVPTAITVAASTMRDTRAAYSNYGPCNDLFAPGDSITAAWGSSDTATRTVSGTSMACPHVSGAAALLLEAAPWWQARQVGATLRETAQRGVLKRLWVGDPNRLLSVGRPLAAGSHSAAGGVTAQGARPDDMSLAMFLSCLTCATLGGALGHFVVTWLGLPKLRRATSRDMIPHHTEMALTTVDSEAT